MKSPIDAHDTRILDFYAGARPDHRGRYLAVIQEWPDAELETVHDYIQWLFPLPERSGFSENAPVLDDRTIQEFRSRADLRQNLRASFLRMLGFYGLEIVETRPPTVRRGALFTKRSGNWVTAGNHNHLRITRVLKSLRILGLESEATAFFDCLTAIRGVEITKRLPGISDETFRFWQSASHGV